MFEKRGPIATYSNNLQFSEIHCTEQEAIYARKQMADNNNLSISSRIMMLIGDLYASSNTCLIHTKIDSAVDRTKLQYTRVLYKAQTLTM